VWDSDRSLYAPSARIQDRNGKTIYHRSMSRHLIIQVGVDDNYQYEKMMEYAGVQDLEGCGRPLVGYYIRIVLAPRKRSGNALMYTWLQLVTVRKMKKPPIPSVLEFRVDQNGSFGPDQFIEIDRTTDAGVVANESGPVLPYLQIPLEALRRKHFWRRCKVVFEAPIE